MLKKVSILIPTYNGEKYISETIMSCLEQTYKNIEIIVIDDGSSDSTRTILMEYTDKIELIFNERNLGIVKNINKLARKSTGDYLIFLGHDDILSDEHIEKMLNEFDTNTVAVHCNSIVIDGDGTEIMELKGDKIQQKKNQNCLYSLALDNFISSCGMMHRTDIFRSVGGWDESYMHYGEWLYYIKALDYGEIKYTIKTKAFYRRHETNITNTFKDKDIQKTLNLYQNRCKDMAFSKSKHTILEAIVFYINRATNIKDKLSSIIWIQNVYRRFLKR